MAKSKKGAGQVAGRRKGSRDSGRKENCGDMCADSCFWSRTCCPDLWLVSLLLVVLPRAAGLPRPVGEDPAAPRPSGRAAGALYEAVRHYRTKASPLLPACCPYTPSCSTYAVKALHQHGALRGGRLVLGRLLRCRPGAAQRRGGRDPVPG
ncbi:membrane protein insertion efficiency factor YidD [Streptomyces sp. NPDC004728]|uniref:membrane protein insertion efficiency factor YidD n=1 Tax=Streptomyces sp. NPDC004728 TaxID=3154289 RepID=UPI0033BF7005